MACRSSISPALCALLAVGCSGTIADSTPDGVSGSGGAGSPSMMPPPASGGTAATAALEPVMRRLTRTEFNHVVADLLGDMSQPARQFPAEETVAGFNNNAEALTLPPVMAQALADLAPKLAAQSVARSKATWAPCLGKMPDEDCARTHLTALGLRAWRRPLEPAEIEALIAVAKLGASHRGWAAGIELASEAVFVSPAFLYRIEEGQPAQTTQDVKPTPYEMAARLSFLLWRSLPDEELFEAARAGRLDTAEAVRAQASRMLDDEKADRMIADLFEQWWELDKADVINKDPEVFKTWDNDLGPLFRAESATFARHVARNGRFSDLLAADYTFANDMLAKHYGLPLPGDKSLQKVNLPAGSSRRGFLTQGAFLATHAGFDQSSPTLRGAFVRQRILCENLPSPPASVDNTPPTTSAATTTRARYAQISDTPSCATCHKRIDPVGYAFEVFDGAAVHRDKENGHPIDATGELLGNDVAFDGPVELVQALSSMEAFVACAATQWFRFAAGRLESTSSEGSLAAVVNQGKQGSIRDALLAFVSTDAFQYFRKPLAQGVSQ